MLLITREISCCCKLADWGTCTANVRPWAGGSLALPQPQNLNLFPSIAIRSWVTCMFFGSVHPQNGNTGGPLSRPVPITHQQWEMALGHTWLGACYVILLFHTICCTVYTLFIAMTLIMCVCAWGIKLIVGLQRTDSLLHKQAHCFDLVCVSATQSFLWDVGVMNVGLSRCTRPHHMSGTQCDDSMVPRWQAFILVHNNDSQDTFNIHSHFVYGDKISCGVFWVVERCSIQLQLYEIGVTWILWALTSTHTHQPTHNSIHTDDRSHRSIVLTHVHI